MLGSDTRSDNWHCSLSQNIFFSIDSSDNINSWSATKQNEESEKKENSPVCSSSFYTWSKGCWIWATASNKGRAIILGFIANNSDVVTLPI